MRDSFIFYRSFYEAIESLDDNSQLQIYKAIANYSLNFTEPKLDGICKTIFTLVKPQLDANNKRFINGSKPKTKQTKSKTEARSKQDQSKTEANNNNNVNVNVNNNIKKNTKKKFSFTLSQEKSLEFASQEYKDKLKSYIQTQNKMTYEDFYNTCINKKKYKYKNYKVAYDNWMKKDFNSTIAKNAQVYKTTSEKNHEYIENFKKQYRVIETEVIE